MKQLLQIMVFSCKVIGEIYSLVTHSLRRLSISPLLVVLKLDLADPVLRALANPYSLFFYIEVLAVRGRLLVLFGAIIHDRDFYFGIIVHDWLCDGVPHQVAIRRTHALTTPRGSSTTASTESSLINRNSWP